MGDRGNIVVLSTNYQTKEREGVWLYAHWGGSRLEETARKAVARSGRVGDPDYLTRIIFCDMIADSLSDEGVRGFDLAAKVLTDDSLQTSEKVEFSEQMLREFEHTTSFGIGLRGAGDQEHPTVVVDAETGDIWLDHNYPTETAEVCPNPNGKG